MTGDSSNSTLELTAAGAERVSTVRRGNAPPQLNGGVGRKPGEGSLLLGERRQPITLLVLISQNFNVPLVEIVERFGNGVPTRESREHTI